MTGDTSIPLADDSRARVPFAIIAVVLLTTSIVTVSTLNNRSTPERNVAPDELNRRLTLASESIISDAVDDAIVKSGQRPVTQPADSPVGRALADDGGAVDYDEGDVFDSYVKLMIYRKVNQRLEQASQTKDSPEGKIVGRASLPALEPDEETVETALDRVELTVGPTEELDKGEYRATVSGVEHNVFISRDGIISDDMQQIYEGTRSYTVTGETAVFEMHSQVEDYEHMLDNDMSGAMSSRMWPQFTEKVTFERFFGSPILEGAGFQRMIWRTEQEVFLNQANYDFQKAAFGTRDQSYPDVMDAANSCYDIKIADAYIQGAITIAIDIASAVATVAAGPAGPAVRAATKVAKAAAKIGKTAAKVGRSAQKAVNKVAKSNKGKVTKRVARNVGDAGDYTNIAYSAAFSGDAMCHEIMYAAFPSTTETADSDMPSTFAFGASENWQPPEGDSGIEDWEGIEEYDREEARQRLARRGDANLEMTGILAAANREDVTADEFERRYRDNTFTANREVSVDPFANRTYINMFDKDPTIFGGPDPAEQVGPDAKAELTDVRGWEFPGGSDTTIVSNEREQVVNNLRLELVNNLDSYETRQMHTLTSENLYGGLIQELESSASRYIYADISSGVTTLSEEAVYGLRNKYIRNIVEMLEKAERARQNSADGMEEMMNRNSEEETTLNEEVVRGQIAIEDALGKDPGAERAEELSEMATHSTDGGELDRWTGEFTERDIFRHDRGIDVGRRATGVPVGNDGLPTDQPVNARMLFSFDMDAAPENLETIETTGIREATDDDGSYMPMEFYKDYPPEPFPDDFEWPADFPSDPTLDDDELPPPSKFDESELPDDVANREEYDFPQDTHWPDDLPDDADQWHIRPVVPEENIYRIVNAEKPSMSFGGGRDSSWTISIGGTTINSYATYIQIRDPESPEFDGELTEDAQELVDDDDTEAYVITIVDVPQTSQNPENPVGNAGDLVPPELQEPPEKDFQFDVHASPGYLSSLPLSRSAEPGIRAPHGGITHSRDTPFTSLTNKVLSPIPNFGVPILPPPLPHVTSTNYWKTKTRGEYARFELRAKPQDHDMDDTAEYTYADDLNGGPEKYVRLEQQVTMLMGDANSPVAVGRVEPIDVEASNHYPFAMPGSYIYPLGNWGLGNYITAPWTPEYCAGSWPETGPAVKPAQLRGKCAGLGAIGDILMGGLFGGGFGKGTVKAGLKRRARAVNKNEKIDTWLRENPDLPSTNPPGGVQKRRSPKLGKPRPAPPSPRAREMWRKENRFRNQRRATRAQYINSRLDSGLEFRAGAKGFMSSKREWLRTLPFEGSAWDTVALVLAATERSSGTYPPELAARGDKLCTKEDGETSEEYCPDVKYRGPSDYQD